MGAPGLVTKGKGLALLEHPTFIGQWPSNRPQGVRTLKPPVETAVPRTDTASWAVVHGRSWLGRLGFADSCLWPKLADSSGGELTSCLRRDPSPQRTAMPGAPASCDGLSPAVVKYW